MDVAFSRETLTNINHSKSAKKWLPVAAHELRQIQIRWNLFSYRKCAATLSIDARTLAKLNLNHLNYSLRLDTLDKIYHRLFFLIPVRFTKTEQEEEYRLLVESRIRILMNEGNIPQLLFNVYISEMDQVCLLETAGR